MSIAIYDEPGSLMIRTLELIKNDQRDLLSLHKDTGLPLYWLRDFKQGKTINPSVNRVQRLYEILTSKQLTV